LLWQAEHADMLSLLAHAAMLTVFALIRAVFVLEAAAWIDASVCVAVLGARERVPTRIHRQIICCLLSKLAPASIHT